MISDVLTIGFLSSIGPRWRRAMVLLLPVFAANWVGLPAGSGDILTATVCWLLLVHQRDLWSEVALILVEVTVPMILVSDLILVLDGRYGPVAFVADLVWLFIVYLAWPLILDDLPLLRDWLVRGGG